MSILLETYEHISPIKSAFAAKNRQKELVPVERVELPTYCLQDSSSTTELNRQKIKIANNIC